MKKLFVTAVLLVLAAAAGTTSAATSAPATGDWSGHFKGVSPPTGLMFTVGKKGTARQVVGFASSSSFKAPCKANKNGAKFGVPTMPTATVDSTGHFKAHLADSQFPRPDTWTLAGSFTSKHAAAGTVTFDLPAFFFGGCKFTVNWTAAFEPPAPPVAGAHYKGATNKDQTQGGRPISFHISADGKQLSGTFGTPLTCNGFDNLHTVTGHNVPIHKDKFTFTFVHMTSAKTNQMYTITGRFVSGRRAVGTTTYIDDTDAGSQSTQCSSSNTWTAHA